MVETSSSMTLLALIDAELGRHRAEHVPFADIQFPKCVKCHPEYWPCPTVRHLSALRVTVEALEEIAGAVDRDFMLGIAKEALAAARKEMGE